MAVLGGPVGSGRARDDVGLVAFYLVALSLGVVLITWRGSNVDAMRVLFGTVLAIDHRALIQIAVVSSVVVLAVAALYRPFTVAAVDPAFLRTVGPLLPYQTMFVVRRTGTSGKLPSVRHAAGAWTDCCCRQRLQACGNWRRRVDCVAGLAGWSPP